MIISKRKFENAIHEAVQEKESEMWERRNREETNRDLWNAIHRLEDQVCRLEARVCNFEPKTTLKPDINLNNVPNEGIHPVRY